MKLTFSTFAGPALVSLAAWGFSLVTTEGALAGFFGGVVLGLLVEYLFGYDD